MNAPVISAGPELEWLWIRYQPDDEFDPPPDNADYLEADSLLAKFVLYAASALLVMTLLKDGALKEIIDTVTTDTTANLRHVLRKEEE